MIGLSVRPLDPSIALDELAALFLGARRDARALARQIRGGAGVGGISVLAAYANGRLVGVLEGIATPVSFQILGVATEPGTRLEESITEALIAEATERFAATPIEASSSRGPEGKAMRRALEANGFSRGPAQVRFGRSLRGCRMSPGPGLSLKRHRDTRPGTVEELLGAIRKERLGDPRPLAATELLEDLLFVAGNQNGAPDTVLWHVAELAGDAVGLALAQRNQPGPGVGTLLYFGFAADARGQGHGSRVHSYVLGLLRAAGMSRYEDATGEANVGMQAVFAHSGCKALGATLPYTLAPAPSSTWSGHSHESSPSGGHDPRRPRCP